LYSAEVLEESLEVARAVTYFRFHINLLLPLVCNQAICTRCVSLTLHWQRCRMQNLRKVGEMQVPFEPFEDQSL